MIVEAAEVIPHHHDRRARPRVALEDRIEVLDAPIHPVTDIDARSGMLVRAAIGRDQPGHRGKRVVLEVLEDRVRRLHLAPERTEPDVADRLERVHPDVGLRAILPCDPRLLELVGERRDVDAGPRVNPVLGDLVQARRIVVPMILKTHDGMDVVFRKTLDREAFRVFGRVIAIVARVVGGRLVVDDPVRLCGHGVEVLGEGGSEHRREEAVGQHEAIGEAPIHGQRAPVELRIAREVVPERHTVEPVHLAAIDRDQPWIERVAEVVRVDVGRRGERDGRAGRQVVVTLQRLADGRAVGARVLAEVVVERVVLLDQEDHVLDRAAGADLGGRGARRTGARGRRRVARSRAAHAAARWPELPGGDKERNHERGCASPTPCELPTRRPARRCRPLVRAGWLLHRAESSRRLPAPRGNR